MKKILLMSLILAVSINAYAKGFDFDGYKKAQSNLPKLPKMQPFADYSGRIWEVELNENSELVFTVAMEKHVLSLSDTYAIMKFLNENMSDKIPDDKKKKVRVMKFLRKMGSPDVIVEEKFFHKGG